jgi:hypothetical protein
MSIVATSEPKSSMLRTVLCLSRSFWPMETAISRTVIPASMGSNQAHCCAVV